jgi:predicted glycosyltransferase
MNREAAVLGTPTYSVFKGKLAAVDHYLIDRGRMAHVAEEKDIPAIWIGKKQPHNRLKGDRVVHEITDAILSTREKE